MKNIENQIVTWLKNYANSSGLKGFVVGVSGGIDSAVTSTLCAKTGLPVLCLDMPIHQKENQVARSQKHITWLMEKYPNVDTKTVNLTAVFDKFVETVEADDDSEQVKLALANSRSRLRMTTLYQYAGTLNRLVVGTGNKVEDFGIGFFTKYGDGGVDLSPIADLMKSEVFALGRHLGVIEEILTAPPTDGLWDDDRTDETQIGATYDDMEWAMKQHELGKKVEDFPGHKKKIMEIYLRHQRKNAHKMHAIPVCVITKEKNV
ncbi:MAG: NAD(+) synthase [Cryomorphaceae bacterium]|nr:NAD(+) synthase [Cryomorphaceae bacterium]